MSRDSKKRGRLVDTVKLTKKIKITKKTKATKEKVSQMTLVRKSCLLVSPEHLQQCNTAAAVGSIVMNACKPFAIFRRGVKTLKFYWGAGRELLKMLQGSMKKRCYLCMCSSAYVGNCVLSEHRWRGWGMRLRNLREYEKNCRRNSVSCKRNRSVPAEVRNAPALALEHMCYS